MKQIGRLDKQFYHIKDNVAYYAITVTVGRAKRKLLIPRYHRALGWIESFGLPPQHEWVVLDSIKPFQHTAMLHINNRKMHEHITFNTDPKAGFHYIKLVRKYAKDTELFSWFEDYTKAPSSIKSEGIFSHKRGIYRYTMNKRVIVLVRAEKLLKRSHKHFLKKITARFNARPDICVIKDFEARGAPPPLFSDMFPMRNTGFSDISGSVCEFGYLRKTGSKLEQSHGDWYKLFEIDHRQFVIEERCGTFRFEKIHGKTTTIVDRYQKRLYG